MVMVRSLVALLVTLFRFCRTPTLTACALAWFENVLLLCENGSHLVHSSDKAYGEDGEDQARDELEGDAKKPQDKREYQAFPLFFCLFFQDDL